MKTEIDELFKDGDIFREMSDRVECDNELLRAICEFLSDYINAAYNYGFTTGYETGSSVSDNKSTLIFRCCLDEAITDVADTIKSIYA